MEFELFYLSSFPAGNLSAHLWVFDFEHDVSPQTTYNYSSREVAADLDFGCIDIRKSKQGNEVIVL